MDLSSEEWPLYRQEGWAAPAVPYLQLTLAFILAMFAWETYLDVRQRRRLRQGARTQELPQELQRVVTEVDSQPQAPAKDSPPDADKKGAMSAPATLALLKSKFDDC